MSIFTPRRVVERSRPRTSIFAPRAGTPGEIARDLAIDQVEGGATEDERNALWAALAGAAKLHKVFTTDEVWDLVPDDQAPREPRLMGWATRTASDQGLIVSMNVRRKSRRRVCHARPILVWARVEGVTW